MSDFTPNNIQMPGQATTPDTSQTVTQPSQLQPEGSYEATNKANTPVQGLSPLQMALRGFVAGMGAGFGQKNAGMGAAAGAAAGNQVAQEDQDRVLKQQQQQLEQQRADQEAASARIRDAYTQAQTAVAKQQLHMITPGDPEYVKKIQEDRATAVDEAIKAGAQVLSTSPDPSVLQKQLMDDHFTKGNFAPQITPMHDASGKTVWGLVVFPQSVNSAPLTLTYPGQDGKPVTKSFAPGTLSLDSWNRIQVNQVAKDVDNQFELYKQKKQEDFQSAQTKYVQGQETARQAMSEKNQLGIAAVNQGAATIAPDGKGSYTITPAAPRTDPFGTQLPPMPKKDIESRSKTFSKDYVEPLQKTEGTFQQFQSILGDLNQGKDMTGAQSVVGLFNAIGISATPLKGMGFKINKNTVEEHTEARGLGQSLYQKLLSLKDGDVITPQQLKDYASLAVNARGDQYVNAANEAHRQGLPVDFLPRGNGKQIDPATAKIYMTVAGGDPNKARAAAQASGWKF